jgi:hypothetical protein
MSGILSYQGRAFRNKELKDSNVRKGTTDLNREPLPIVNGMQIPREKKPGVSSK